MNAGGVSVKIPPLSSTGACSGLAPSPLLAGSLGHLTAWRLVLLILLLSACGRFTPATPELGPAEVTEAFYRWYIGYPGNALSDNAYRTSPYLAHEMVEKVDALQATTSRGGADPFLLAQDVPERFDVGEATIEEKTATVPLALYWGGNPTPTMREVRLAIIDGEWRIVGVGEG